MKKKNKLTNEELQAVLSKISEIINRTNEVNRNSMRRALRQIKEQASAALLDQICYFE
jgi:hypothetical protein